MIARYRKRRKIYFVLLLVCICMMSIGFSAFSSELTISSNAIVKPDSSAFKVLFSSSGSSFLTNKVNGTVTGDAKAGSASIDNTGDVPTIKDLTATFTGPGQSVKYEFYAYNAGAYNAYLTGIKFNNVDGGSSSKVCTAIDSSSVTSSLLEAACNDINVSIDVGTTTSVMSSTSGITGHSLGKGLYEKIVVTISYTDNSNLADGDFKVEFGDIGLTYSTVDAAANLISFTVDGKKYYAEPKEENYTSWADWLESGYNTDGFYEYLPQTGTGMTSGFATGGYIYTGDDKKVSGQYAGDTIDDGSEFFTE